MAYGFRDDAYFFLKIRAAFPEFRDEPNNYGHHSFEVVSEHGKTKVFMAG